MRSISGVVAPVSTGPARGPARASERDRTRSADHAALPPRVAPVAPLRSRHASGSRWLHPVRGLRPRPVANGRLERARLPLALASRDGRRAIRRLSRQADRLRRPAGRRPGGSRSQTEARRVSAPEAWSADGTTAGARRANGATARHEKGPVSRRGLIEPARRRVSAPSPQLPRPCTWARAPDTNARNARTAHQIRCASKSSNRPRAGASLRDPRARPLMALGLSWTVKLDGSTVDASRRVAHTATALAD